MSSLLALGISSANLLDREESLEHMRNWLKYHPQYSKIAGAWPEWQGGAASMSDKQAAIRNMFGEALKLNPTDYRLHEALGVSHFIARDFETAAMFFREALKHQYNAKLR